MGGKKNKLVQLLFKKKGVLYDIFTFKHHLTALLGFKNPCFLCFIKETEALLCLTFTSTHPCVV